MKTKVLFVLAAAAISVTVSSHAFAGAHTWDVNEIFSNADGTIQFVELRECCGGAFETNVPGLMVTSLALGNNYQIPGPALAAPTSNRTLLFATPAFAALPGVPTPNYIFPANFVPFFSVNGDTISYSPYDSIPFAAGALPTDGVHSLNRSGATLVVGCNSPRNYAGQTGFVNLNCAMQGDVDGSGAVDGNDVAAFVRAKLGTPAPGDSAACAEYCTGTLAGDVAAFVNDLL